MEIFAREVIPRFTDPAPFPAAALKPAPATI
jgi:hypothetical protein